MEPNPSPLRGLSVFAADAIRCEFGANAGDPMGLGSELVLDDIYVLQPRARQERLSVMLAANGQITIAPGSLSGTPGHRVFMDCLVSLMSVRGGLQELLVMVEVDCADHVVKSYLLPLAEIEPKVEHVLMRVDRNAATIRFARLACVSFARGTTITLAGGVQRPIEHLKPGDAVLTRDDGMQPLRWIGHHAQRAVGCFAPIRVAAGALNNTGDLVVSANHRFFVYQRKDMVGAGHRDVLVRAADLVDGRQITRVRGGFVEYFQLLFDRHQIIYAEGIAAETLLLDNQTRSILPPDALGLPSQMPVPGREVDLAERPGAAETLRRASGV